MSRLGVLVLLAVAAVCGAIGQALVGYSVGGCLVSLIVGFIGALLGSWLARQLSLPDLFVVTVDGQPFPIVWAIIGSAITVLIISLLTGRNRAWAFSARQYPLRDLAHHRVRGVIHVAQVVLHTVADDQAGFVDRQPVVGL